MAATDWIKVRTNLSGDPRVHGVCDRIDAAPATVVGALVMLWSAADSQTADGFLPSMTLKSIDRITGVAGIGAALAEVGWLEVKEGGVQIPRFGDHNGTSAKKRAQNATKQSNHRSRGGKPDTDVDDEGDERNPEVVTDVTDGSNDPVTKKEKEKEKDSKPKVKVKNTVELTLDGGDSAIPAACSANQQAEQPGLPGAEVFALTTDAAQGDGKPSTDAETDIEKIFGYWKLTMDSPKSKLDDKRKGVIRRALKAGYSPRDLCRAIQGCSLTPHNQGKNPNGQKYLGIHICLKDADQIDRFIANSTSPPVATASMSKSEQVTQANKGLGARVAALAAARGMADSDATEQAAYVPPNDGKTIEMG